jgi:GntR family transcriptional repressor for pyruvate dehydrogenase complex
MTSQNRRPKASEVVADWMRQPIISGELAEGDPFPREAELSEQFGVSRPTVREAIRILESEGLIVVRRGIGGGARARKPQPAAVARAAGFVLQERGTTASDVYRCRAFLEVPAVELLMERRDGAEVLETLEAALVAEQRALKQAGGTGAVSEGQFHRVLVELSGSPTLELYATITNQIIYAHTRNFMRERGSSGDSAQVSASAHTAHTRMVELIRSGDVAAAQAHWRDHLTSGSKVLLGDHDLPIGVLDPPRDPRTMSF